MEDENKRILSLSNEICKQREKMNEIKNVILNKHGKEKKKNILSDVSNIAWKEIQPENKRVTQKIQTSPPKTWDDLDLEDEGDPVMVSEYINEIISYMKELEIETLPKPGYISIQREITWHMRSVLVDWLIEIQWKLKLLPETLFLTVNIVDRFLSLRTVSVDKLQLVGISATMISSKYEEIVTPSVSNFILLTDNAYNKEELLKAERYMLHVLGYVLSYPSPLTFLRRVSKADNYDIRSRTIAKYLMECSLIEQSFLGIPGSLLSAASIYLAKKILRTGEWNNNLSHYSGYGEKEVSKCVELFHRFFKKEVNYEAVFKKYSNKKFMRVSQYIQEYYQEILSKGKHKTF